MWKATQCLGMSTLTEAWHDAASAAPNGWNVQGLRCASKAIDTDRRTSWWIAEACGPDNACIQVTTTTPEAALAALAAGLRDLTP
jgi:hypothetical protein